MGSNLSSNIDKLEVLECEIFYEIIRTKHITSSTDRPWVVCVYSNSSNKKLTKYVMSNLYMKCIKVYDKDIEYYEYNKPYKKLRNKGYCKLYFVDEYINASNIKITLEIKTDVLHHVYEI